MVGINKLATLVAALLPCQIAAFKPITPRGLTSEAPATASRRVALFGAASLLLPAMPVIAAEDDGLSFLTSEERADLPLTKLSKEETGMALVRAKKAERAVARLEKREQARLEKQLKYKARAPARRTRDARRSQPRRIDRAARCLAGQHR
jgi:hypothetical protein